MKSKRRKKKMVKKIAVIGYGYIGRAVVNLFKDHYEVLARDQEKEYFFRDNVAEGFIQKNDYHNVNRHDLAIICVPTPMKEDGSCDISIIEDVVKGCDCPLILIKSTVPPKTTEMLRKKYKKRICFSPEYLGEGKYFMPFWKNYPHPTEMKYHYFQIFGGAREDTQQLVEVFQRVLGPNCQYWQTDSTTAELVKYMENSWGATKVTFANEFYRIAKAFGVDYRELRELFLLDGRVERIHTAVFEGKFGFGGRCFPKDVNAIVKASEEAGYSPDLIKEVLKSNKKFIKDNEKKG